MGSYRKRKSPLGKIIVLSALIVCIAAGLGVIYIKNYMPVKERAELDMLYESAEDRVSVVLNEELEGAKGLERGGICYLPLDFVNEKLNDRFFWDPYEEKMLYSLPEETLVFLPDSVDESGNRNMIAEPDSGEVYLSSGLIERFTSMRSSFYSDAPMRIMINTNFGEIRKAAIKKDTQLRTGDNVKKPVIADLEKGVVVEVLNTAGGWSEVRIPGGHIGYILNSRLGDEFGELLESNYHQPVYKNISREEEIVLVWHQVTNKKANSGMEGLLKRTKGVNVISPTWYALTDNTGSFTSLADKSYVDKAHSMGIEVWALIDNFSDNVNSKILMSSTSNRTRLIENLMKEVDLYGLDGINLDIESIHREAGRAYVQFIRELSIACRKKGIVLSVDNHIPTAENAFYNRKEQGIVADYVIIMGYDEHYKGSEAGSVASIGFTSNGIRDMLKEVPADKVIHGVPFYTRLWWEEDGKTQSEAVNMERAWSKLKEHETEPVWLEDIGQYYGEYEENGTLYRIWLENKKSLELKAREIKENKLAGVACWKLGLETEDVWDVIDSHFNK